MGMMGRLGCNGDYGINRDIWAARCGISGTLIVAMIGKVASSHIRTLRA